METWVTDQVLGVSPLVIAFSKWTGENYISSGGREIYWLFRPFQSYFQKEKQIEQLFGQTSVNSHQYYSRNIFLNVSSLQLVAERERRTLCVEWKTDDALTSYPVELY